MATWYEELTHLKRPWCWKRLKAGGVGDDRGWDGWMATPTQWTWVWVDSGIWWWTGRPGVLWFTGLQRVRHDWVTELNWTELGIIKILWDLVPAYLFIPLPAIIPRASHTIDLEHCFLFCISLFIYHIVCLPLGMPDSLYAHPYYCFRRWWFSH